MEPTHTLTLTQLRNLLSQSFPDVDLEGLESSPDRSRWLGFIASDRFVDMDFLDRQDLLRAALHERLTPAQLQHLGPLIPVTFEEASLQPAASEW